MCHPCNADVGCRHHHHHHHHHTTTTTTTTTIHPPPRCSCAIGLWSKRFRAIVTSRCLSPGRNANATRSDMMMRLITTTRHGGKRGCAGCNTPSGAQLEPTHSGPNPPKQPLSPWGGREEGERAEPRSIYPETAAREGAEQAERGPAREATAVPRRESNPGTALPRPTTRPTTQAAWGVTVLRAPPGVAIEKHTRSLTKPKQ